MTHQTSQAPSIKSSTDLNLVSVHELFEYTHNVFNLIARRAFEIFEARGRIYGNDCEDWLRGVRATDSCEVSSFGIR
jgi:hypothetical protein